MTLKNIFWMSIFSFLGLNSLQAIHISAQENLDFGHPDPQRNIIKRKSLVVDFSPTGEGENIHEAELPSKLKVLIPNDNKSMLIKLTFKNILNHEEYKSAGNAVSNLIANDCLPSYVQISYHLHEAADHALLGPFIELLELGNRDDLKDIALKHPNQTEFFNSINNSRKGWNGRNAV